MNTEIVSVIASGSFACTTTAGVLKAFPAVLKKQVGYTGIDELKKFADANPNKLTFVNFDSREIQKLADALYEMRIIRLHARAKAFRLLFKEDSPKRVLPTPTQRAVFEFADTLLRVIEKHASLQRFTNQSKFVLRFVMLPPVMPKPKKTKRK